LNQVIAQTEQQSLPRSLRSKSFTTIPDHCHSYLLFVYGHLVEVIYTPMLPPLILNQMQALSFSKNKEECSVSIGAATCEILLISGDINRGLVK